MSTGRLSLHSGGSIPHSSRNVRYNDTNMNRTRFEDLDEAHMGRMDKRSYSHRVDRSDRRQSIQVPIKEVSMERKTWDDDQISYYSEEGGNANTNQLTEVVEINRDHYRIYDHRDQSMLEMRFIEFTNKCYIQFNGGDTTNLLELNHISRVGGSRDQSTTQSTNSNVHDTVIIYFEDKTIPPMEVASNSIVFGEAMKIFGRRIGEILTKQKKEEKEREKMQEREQDEILNAYMQPNKPVGRSVQETTSSGTPRKRSSLPPVVKKEEQKKKKKKSWWRRLLD